jgi:hypothetical protein
MVGCNCALYMAVRPAERMNLKFKIPVVSWAADAEQEEKCSRRMASNYFMD